MREKEIVKSLKQIQRVYGWSKAKMAKELAVSRPLLSQIYTGERFLQLNTLKKIILRFPELKPQVVKILEVE
jgi:transcriptional regulator with XRE-family HTH domain